MVNTTKFINGIPLVKASDLGYQFYCEQKMEYDLAFGREMTPERKAGISAHEIFNREFEKDKEIFVKQISLKDIKKQKGIMYFAEEMIGAFYKNSIIVGIPDRVYFINGKPWLVVEFKYINYYKDFLSYHVQAQAYCLIFRQLGFDCSDLSYVLIVSKQELAFSPLQEKFMETLSSSVFQYYQEYKYKHQGRISLNVFNSAIYLHSFASKLEEAEKNITWALEYWKGKREAQITKNLNRCRNCEFLKICKQFKGSTRNP